MLLSMRARGFWLVGWLCLVCGWADARAEVAISTRDYEGRPQFWIETASASYSYDRAGGGFSRMIDRDGNDWIAFRKEPLREFPASAAAGYRGIPNLLFGGGNPDAGAGHPGFDLCESEQVDDRTIRTRTKSGRWGWQWEFSDESATLTVLKADPAQAYWFLYEGPIGGKWSPETHFWGTDQAGPLRTRPNSADQMYQPMHWAYFGDDSQSRVLLALQRQKDETVDNFWYLGASTEGLKSADGMVVFGFGRGEGTQPLLRGAGQQFRVGFVESVSASDERGLHARVTAVAERWSAEEDWTADEKAPAQSTQSHAKPATVPWRGPQPAEGKPWPESAHFFQRYWFQLGSEFMNPPVNDRFRVNDPYVATHPEFHARKEPKGNGMMLIRFDEVMRDIGAARLYVELWGGHPHSNNRRVTINGRTTYPIETPSDDHCTHVYKNMPVKLTDLVQGYNALQFNVDGEHTFWGHFIVEEAALDALLLKGDARLKPIAALADVPPRVQVDRSELESIQLSMQIASEVANQVARVHYFAYYDGYDENGDGINLDWHGMTKRKEPLGHLGTSDVPPYLVEWDTSMIVAQERVQVRAVVEFRGVNEQVAAEEKLRERGERYWKAKALCLQTAPSEPFAVTHPPGIQVVVVPCENPSVPFWSRADREKRCEFSLPVPASSIERANLSVAVWDGGAGTIEHYFMLNEHPLAIAGEGKHDVLYSTLELDKAWLQSGKNTATLVSDTEHHGIEVLYPGPAITIRYDANAERLPNVP